ncbi:MAG: Vitamin transporter BtuB, partial [Pseudomonadota bacterium]
LDLSQSTAKRRGGIIETTAGLPGNVASPGNISWTGFDGGNLSGATYSTSVNYGDRSAVGLTDVMGWGGGTALPQAGYSKLPFVDDKLNAARLSFKTDIKSDFFSSFEGGYNITDREKTRAYVEGRLVIPGGNPYGSVAVPGSGTQVFNGVSGVIWDPRGSVGPVYDVAAKFVRDIANKDWTVNEKVSTLYGKLDIDGKIAGSAVRGNVGLQMVSTDQSSRAFSVDNAPCPGDVCPTNNVTDGKSYIDFLPSVNFVLDVGKDQVLRMGYSRTLARPTINDMRASLGFGVNATAAGGPRFEGDAGNPKLEPFRANALDISYESYFGGNKGYWGVAAFHKDLDTYIVRTQRSFDFAPYVTAAGTIPAAGTTGILTQPLNGSGGTIAGLEFSLSLPLGMVTKSMDGFGVQASYSSTKSSVKLPTTGVSVDSINTARIPLPGLSENVGSLAVYYEKSGFAVRVAQRYRSDFVGEVSSFTGDRQLTYVKAEKVMDMQVSYELQSGPAKGLSVILQGYNLGDARYIRYRDNPNNQVENTRYGKTYLVGLNYKL